MTYIGEGENILHRLYAYTRIYGERSKKTEARIARRIRTALASGQTVLVDAATVAKINLSGEMRRLDMGKVAERRFAEAAAVLAEAERDVEGQVISLNRILKEDWWLED